MDESTECQTNFGTYSQIFYGNQILWIRHQEIYAQREKDSGLSIDMNSSTRQLQELTKKGEDTESLPMKTQSLQQEHKVLAGLGAEQRALRLRYRTETS